MSSNSSVKNSLKRLEESFGRAMTGIGKCPILGLLDIAQNSSHKKDHIPNGWVMFNGDI